MKSRYSSKIQLALLALSHGVTDSYANFPAALSKNLVDKLKLSNAKWGMLVSLQSLSSSMSQIVFGYFADKFGRGIFVVLGPIFACVFLSLIGIAPSYAILAVLILIGGFGVASFHPQGAATAGKLAKGQKGLGVSVFTFGGSIGYAMGPLIATGIVSIYGLKGTPLAISWGFIMPLVLYFVFYKERVMESPRQKISLIEAIRPNSKTLFLLFAIVVFRAGTSTIFTNFLRIFLAKQASLRLSEISEIASGGIVTLYLISGSIGGLIGGALSDRISRKGIIIFSLCVATPFLWLATHSTGPLFLVYLFLAGFILTSSTPINIVMAQEMMPSNASTASSFMMGLGWGVGGLLSTPFGRLADAYGIEHVMGWLAFIPLATTMFAILLPSDTRDK